MRSGFLSGTSKPTSSLFILTLLCGFLMVFRMALTHQIAGIFLVWNFLLAWIPLLFALWSRRQLQKYKNTNTRYRLFTTGILLAFWLLFFPNAPYIITDLIHLSHLEKNMLWFDSVGIFVVALTGLALGFYSLHVSHDVLNKMFGKFMAWIFMLASLGLSGFGLYLGRFVRFNSWDLFFHPLRLFRTALGELNNPLALQMTFVFSIVLIGLYLSMYNLIPRNNESIKNVA
ncbi:DUF1361 domain-containing protein [Emticicia sp. CRIBPO]|uniref:DUF1361 domain-containing protein n=1 Tax=Emticicia sp. CRIBPO TaxID=2683258 RepID=UPI001412ADD7|nr:DUF1361 domain-containing protein [Emticicia sp. CRIBPO]NBA86976.1 DUF1361 domain-containing protein [Emticicia sp. CRIBPO]